MIEDKRLTVTLQKILIWPETEGEQYIPAAPCSTWLKMLSSTAVKSSGIDFHILMERRRKHQIHIVDTGIGIAEDDLKHYIEPFYRADRSVPVRQGDPVRDFPGQGYYLKTWGSIEVWRAILIRGLCYHAV